jgi:hypothetical protein
LVRRDRLRRVGSDHGATWVLKVSPANRGRGVGTTGPPGQMRSPCNASEARGRWGAAERPAPHL